VHDPFKDFIKVPPESTIGFELDPLHNGGHGLNSEPLVAFSLSAPWD
jgi:hypothetical protein